MKILLINPSVYNDTGRYKSASPPLSLLFLAGYLEKNGYPDTKVIDTDIAKLSWPEIGELFLKEKPDVVGIGGTAVVLPTIIRTAQIAREKLPSCLVVVGGYGATNEPEKVLRWGKGAIDLVVVGEGEITLLEIVKQREKQSKDFSNIAGLAFLNQAGEFILTASREYIKDLDSIPWPAFHLLTPKFSEYPGQPLGPKLYEIKKPIITVLASRGCPHRCVFCSMGSKMYRQRKPKNVVDQIEYYKNEFGVKSVAIYDDEFVGMSPGQNEWVKEICNEIIRRNLGLKFITQGRCSQYVELETLKKMKEAGFRWIWWGVESGSQRLLDEVIHKDIKIENVYRTFALSKEAGLKSLMFIMVGFPGETLADIKLTCDLVKKIKPDTIQIKIATPYPGTELRRYLESHNLLDNKLDKLADYYKLQSDRYVHHHTEEMTAEEIRKQHRLLVFRFMYGHWYFIKFALKSLTTLNGWKKIFKRTGILMENLWNYLKVSFS